MAARKRLEGEAFDKYRENLKREQMALDARLYGNKVYQATEIVWVPNPAGPGLAPVKALRTRGPARRSTRGVYYVQRNAA